MKKTKKLFNLFVLIASLIVITPNAIATQSILNESGSLSDEEIIKVIEDDEAGEGSDSEINTDKVEIVLDGEYEGDNLPAPTPENSTVQGPLNEKKVESETDIETKTEAKNSSVEKNNNNENKQNSFSQKTPFSPMLILFIGIPIAVLLLFVIRKYAKKRK